MGSIWKKLSPNILETYAISPLKKGGRSSQMAKNKANRSKANRIRITDVQDTRSNTLIEKTAVRNMVYTTDKEAQ